MVPDGYFCSLFSDYPLLKEHDRWITPNMDSPRSRIKIQYFNFHCYEQFEIDYLYYCW
ncbi:hypothetical protein RO3G_08384 [Rhizopus delemar RA 99-880]|uniref:Uncharacterized protein n=1 Tax=Rhizopus delemar (strain RA 99-880 / ATCC MYA-4621 / FGSC 9543 / NRRL 43880) TaxID=246409 RepID=I1C5E9_RHIO9|nr:hypothetical protein RO3G_08384 [Rhizopus delemar RA 99-880]|eukprot:EIE83679.1 hypothetical protein RO3G_08384 [Rhizopus delemar RA 99-880]